MKKLLYIVGKQQWRLVKSLYLCSGFPSYVYMINWFVLLCVFAVSLQALLFHSKFSPTLCTLHTSVLCSFQYTVSNGCRFWNRNHGSRWIRVTTRRQKKKGKLCVEHYQNVTRLLLNQACLQQLCLFLRQIRSDHVLNHSLSIVSITTLLMKNGRR